MSSFDGSKSYTLDFGSGQRRPKCGMMESTYESDSDGPGLNLSLVVWPKGSSSTSLSCSFFGVVFFFFLSCSFPP